MVYEGVKDLRGPLPRWDNPRRVEVFSGVGLPSLVRHPSRGVGVEVGGADCGPPPPLYRLNPKKKGFLNTKVSHRR